MASYRMTITTALLGAVAACSSDDTTPATPTATTASSTGGAAGSAQGAGTAGSSVGGTGGAGGSGVMDGGDIGDAACVKFARVVDGGCQCFSYVPTMCSTACVDTKKDPNACGSCDKKCDPGAGCNDGMCGSAPTTTVAAQTGCGEMRLAVMGSTLYFTDKMHGTVKSLSLSAMGAMPAVIASNQAAPTFVVADASGVYWINSGDKSVMKSGGDGGAPQKLASMVGDGGTAAINALLLSGPTLYFAAGDRIYKVASSGGAPALLGVAQEGGIPRALAVDASYIYYPTEIHNDVEFMRLSDGFTMDEGQRVASSQGSLFYDTITVVGGKAYWGNGANLQVGKVGNDAGQNGLTLAGTTSLNPISAFVIGATSAYFASTGPDGAVERSALVKADPDAPNFIVARDQNATTSIALDATRVYWANDCAILSAPQ